MGDCELKEEKHHKQLELCTTRPAYRQGRKLTAVKVYTVNNESNHLFIYGVPGINLRQELKALCCKYGDILNIHVVQGYRTEAFTECFHVQFQRLQSARIAKRLIDSRSFYGGILHVCYAPEYESIEETRTKLLQRDKDVLSRLPNTETQKIPTNKRPHFKNKQNPKKPKLDFPDIYLQDDPILKSIGPQLPEQPEINKEVNSEKIVPNYMTMRKKRIVFRNKKEIK